MRDADVSYTRFPFTPIGSDERQYSSPGFRIPVGTIFKDRYYDNSYYHTSLDDLDFVKAENVVAAFELYLAAIDILEGNRIFRSLAPNGEARLGRRGLYPETGGAFRQNAACNDDAKIATDNSVDLILWILFLSDGSHNLIDVAEQSGFGFQEVVALARTLEDNGLIEDVERSEPAGRRPALRDDKFTRQEVPIE